MDGIALQRRGEWKVVPLPINRLDGICFARNSDFGGRLATLIIFRARRPPRSMSAKHMPQRTQVQSDTSTQALIFNVGEEEGADSRVRDENSRIRNPERPETTDPH